MKISYRTHPVLRYLELEKPPIIIDNEYVDKGHILKPEFDKFWSTHRETFKSNAMLISEPFAVAMQHSINKLISNELYKELGDQSGLMLYKKIAICYDCKRFDNDGKGYYKINLALFHEAKLDILATDNVQLVSDRTPLRTNSDDRKQIAFYWQFVQAILLFKKYATVETKLILANKNTKFIDCKYVNDTGTNLLELNSKWFTTLVKSDAFKVRGHFRLQPKKKDGEWTKELIWIEGFEKNGYTAPARKLNQQA